MNTQPIQRVIAGLVAGVFLFGLVGCSSFDIEPAQDSGFIKETEKLNTNNYQRAPFQRAWVAPDYHNKDLIKKIYVAPVDTEYLMESDDWGRIGRNREEIAEDVKQLADYMQDEFKSEIGGWEDTDIDIVDNRPSGPDAFILELAIVELVPSSAARNAVGTAAGFVVPGGGLISTGGVGSIAVEGRIIKSDSGERIAIFADRQKDRITPVNLAGLTWYGHSKNHIQAWARQMAELLNTDENHQVARRGRLTLHPW